MAQADGAMKFKWGMVNQATVNACEINGCGEVQEYLGVTLNDLTTTISENQLVIQWDTASEEKNLGMNLWCAQFQDGQLRNITQLNNQLILSKAVLPEFGAAYSSADYSYVNTNLQAGVQHCVLEDVDTRGQCTLHCDQVGTVVVSDSNLSNTELDELRVQAIAFCHEHQPAGICLELLLQSQ
jgi:hypothetical protein